MSHTHNYQPVGNSYVPPDPERAARLQEELIGPVVLYKYGAIDPSTFSLEPYMAIPLNDLDDIRILRPTEEEVYRAKYGYREWKYFCQCGETKTVAVIGISQPECDCAEMDWTGCDLTQPHHPNCGASRKVVGGI